MNGMYMHFTKTTQLELGTYSTTYVTLKFIYIDYLEQKCSFYSDLQEEMGTFTFEELDETTLICSEAKMIFSEQEGGNLALRMQENSDLEELIYTKIKLPEINEAYLSNLQAHIKIIKGYYFLEQALPVRGNHPISSYKN